MKHVADRAARVVAAVYDRRPQKSRFRHVISLAQPPYEARPFRKILDLAGECSHSPTFASNAALRTRPPAFTCTQMRYLPDSGNSYGRYTDETASAVGA